MAYRFILYAFHLSMIFYFVLVFICIGLMVATYILIKIYDSKSACFYIDYSYIEYSAQELFRVYVIDDIKIKKGNKYCYNPTQKTIYIRESEKYSCLDLFKCFHEIGHALDYKINYPIISKLWLIDKYICIYSWWLMILLGTFNYVEIIKCSLVNILIVIELVALAINLVFIVVFESRASSFAYFYINNIVCKRCAIVSVCQQVIFSCSLMIPLMLLLVI